VRTGRVKDVAPDRARRRLGAPRVVVPDPADPLEAHARVPHAAHRVVTEALQEGPVLVWVPRGGYAAALQCRRCRHAARCPHCSGPLALSAGPDPGDARGAGAGSGTVAGVPVCRWCARPATGWACPECGERHVRAGVVGVTRSAEELGRAFPGVPVTTSRAGHRVARVPAGPRLVVATPGAEPEAEDGYAAALLLDGDLALSRRGLAVEEETLRRWLSVAALVRPVGRGGRLVLVADPGHRVVQALVQDAPEALADRLCDERGEVGLPPVGTVARVLGEERDLADVAAAMRDEGTLRLDGPEGVVRPSVVGPAPTEEEGRWQLLVRGGPAEVVGAVRHLLATRSAAKAPGRLVVRVDPQDLD
jgi:primosomal protein N' (replication factor Y) (superfamily II helicase)